MDQEKAIRLYLLMAVLFICLLPIFTFSQAEKLMDKKITIHFSDENLVSALHKIEEKINTRFMYDALEIKKSGKKIAGVYENETAAAVLSKILSGTGFDYQQLKEKIIIYKQNTAIKATEKDDKNSAMQHTGSLKGRIVDFETSQPLPGATVQLEGITPGVIADDKGFYRFREIPAGSYTLVASFIGYQRSIVKAVTIAAGKQSVYDIKMQSGSSSLTEVVVGGNRLRIKAVTHTTEKQLLEEIKSARAVVSGISNEQISKMADRNGAEIVKRISGVTVVDEKFIVVRGMNQRYNITYLNGNIAPATELYSRTFAYDLLPSPIIDRILVYKSPTASLLGDYSGGAVEVYTKNARPVRHFDAGFQVGYRPGSNFGSIINGYKGGKWDWLGFDDGTRKLSPSLPGYFESGGSGNALSQQKLLKAFTPILQYGTKKSTPDVQVFGNYYDNWRLGKWRLYDLTSLTYTKETTHYEVYRQAGNTYAFAGSGNVNTGDLNTLGNDDQSTEKAKLNLLQNFTLKINDRHQMVFDNFLLNEGSSTTSIYQYRMNIPPELQPNFGYQQHRRITLLYQQRFLYNGNLGGEHNLGRHRLKWNLGYGFSRQDVPDQRILNFYTSYFPGGYDPYSAELPDSRWRAITGVANYSELFFGKISRIFTRNKENIYNGSADYTYPVSSSFSFKAGTYQLFRLREVSRRFFKVNNGNLNGAEVGFDYAPDGASVGYGSVDLNKINFRQDQLGSIWSSTYFPDDNSGLKIFDMTSTADSYTASEQMNSGYLMGDWKTGKWIVNAGLRLEHDQQKIAGAYKDNDGVLVPVKVSNTQNVLLPSVNASWQPDSAVVIRVGYGRTVNRPEFRELTPYNDFDFIANEQIIGNPNVVSATINNFDLRAELYPRSSAANEMISLGVFYKSLQNPIQRIRNESTTSGGNLFTSISFINADRAKVYGIELELRKSLRFIPGSLFRHLSVVANATYIKSETDKYTFRDAAEKADIGEFRGRPLQGQAPYVANAGLFYENAGWGTKMGITYVVNGPSIYALSIRNPNATGGGIYGQDAFRPDLLELPRHLLDLSFSQRLFRSLTMRLNIQNLLAQPYRLIEDHNSNQRYDKEEPVTSAGNHTYYIGDNIYRQYNPGRYYTMNFTYSF